MWFNKHFFFQTDLPFIYAIPWILNGAGIIVFLSEDDDNHIGYNDDGDNEDNKDDNNDKKTMMTTAFMFFSSSIIPDQPFKCTMLRYLVGYFLQL